MPTGWKFNTSPCSINCLKRKYRTQPHSWKSLEVRRGIVEVSILPGCGIISLGDWCPVFQDSVMVNNFKGQNVHGHEQWTGSKVGPTSGLHFVKNIQISCPCHEIEPQFFDHAACKLLRLPITICRDNILLSLQDLVTWERTCKFHYSINWPQVCITVFFDR